MSEVSYLDLIADSMKYANKAAIKKWFPPTRKGEPPTRFCERCGAEYEVKSRQQKYCSSLCQQRANWK